MEWRRFCTRREGGFAEQAGDAGVGVEHPQPRLTSIVVGDEGDLLAERDELIRIRAVLPRIDIGCQEKPKLSDEEFLRQDEFRIELSDFQARFGKPAAVTAR